MSHPAARPEGFAPGGARKPGVMVVDDSAVFRGLLARWLEADPDLSLVGRFANGQLALDGLEKCAPDVIVLDIEMPVMDGMATLPKLLERRPGIKVIIASTPTRRNAEISFKALSLGAFDYIAKPETNAGLTASNKFREDLIGAIKRVAGGGDVRHLRRVQPQGLVRDLAPASARPVTLRRFSAAKPRVLAIGSSTGGPNILARLIADIAPAIPHVPVLIAQHMPPTFTSILADHIARGSGRNAKEAENGEPLRPGIIYVAPGGRHMGVAFERGAVVLSVYDGPLVNFCKPAVDPLFQSVANVFGATTLALVLTGMGQDGAAGALKIAEAGGTVIAQDEATSVVWGMPGAAVAAGACAAVLPIDLIARRAFQLFRGAAA